MTEKIILGITEVDDSEHVVTGRYTTLSILDESELVEVIEVANSRLAHTAVENGNLLGRIAVFSRFISKHELELRNIQFGQDSQGYEAMHLRGL